jgi:PAS domain S-box-containing protein
MKTPDQESTAENQSLQRCINNLVEVLAFPADQKGGESAGFVSSLLETLLQMLDLDFVYARLNEMEEKPKEFVRLAESLKTVCNPSEAGELVELWLGSLPQNNRGVIKNPFGAGSFSIVILPLGRESEFGQIVAASQRSDFPRQTESLVLDMAAKQALIGIQGALLQKEQKRSAVELNRDINERAEELVSISEELKKKVSELKRIEDELSKSKRQLHLVVDNIPGLVALLSPTGRVEVVNRELSEYFGQTLEELNQWGTNGTVHAEDLPHVVETFTRSLADGTPYDILQRFRRFDGVYRWFQNKGFPVRESNGQITRWCVLLTDIDERERAEEALRMSERQFRLLVETIPALVWCGTPEGELAYLNQRAVEYLGQTAQSLTGGGWLELVHPDHQDTTIRRWLHSATTGVAYEDVYQIRRSDGQYRWIQSVGEPFRDTDGRIACWYGLIIDIDERKRAEETLAVNEGNLKLIIDTIPVLAWSSLPDGNADYFNQHYLDYLGLSAEQANGRGWTSAVHPDDIGSLTTTWRGIMDKGEPGEAEVRLRRFDGEYRWFLFRANPLRDENGEIVKWYGVNIDIEDRKRAEATLRRNEAFLHDVERLSRVGGWRYDVAGDVVEETPEIHRVYDVQPGDEITKPSYWFGRIHPDDRPRVMEEFERCLREGDEYRAAYRIVVSDGGIRYHHSIGHPVTNDAGELVEFIGAVMDMTEQWQATNELERAYESLRESERESRLIVDSIPGLVAVFAPDGKVEFVNRQIVEYYGLTLEDLKQWEAGNATHPEDLPRAIEHFTHSITTGEPFDFEVRARRIDGVYRWVQTRGFPLRDEDGRIVRWYNLIVDIDERKRAEEALAASERNLKLIIDTIPVLAWSALPDGKADYFNQHYLDYIGFSAEQASGWGWTAAVHPEDLEGLAKTWQSIRDSGELGEAEARLRRFDGEYRWFLFRANPMRDESGKIVKWYGQNTDIEDRKRSEFLLRESERQFKTIFDEAGTGIALVDLTTGKPIRNNRALQIMLDCTEDELGVIETYDQLTYEDDRERDRTTFRELRAGKRESLKIEKHFILKSGRSLWTNIVFTLLRADDGRPRYIIAIFEDITERKLALETLREKQELLDLAQKSAGATAFDWHIQREINVWSPEQEALYGLAPGTFDGTYQSWKKLIHPSDWAGVLQSIQHAHETGKVAAEFRVIWADGSVHWLATSGRMFFDDAGKPFRMVGFTTDITRRKLVEEELRRSEAFLADAQRLSHTGSFMTNFLRDEHYWSDELYRICELEPGSKLTTEGFRSIIHPDDLVSFDEASAQAIEGNEPDLLDFRIVTPKGVVKHLRSFSHRVDPNRPVFVGAIQDVTQRRTSEEALSEARSELARVARAMSLGVLTASIAHEINQPLSGIITNASTCLRMLDANPPNIEGARETARRTIRDGNRASDVIKRLRSLFSRKDFTVEIVDLNEAAREVIELSRNELQRNRIVLRTELAEDLPPIAGDRVQLQQVILNLLLNAVDAMSNVDDRPRELMIATVSEGTESVQLSVSDVGVGFAPSESEKLFDAFYTTKKGGMGIGLSVSRSIIEKHRGRLWAEPNEGPGAMFSLSIPAVEKSEQNKVGKIVADEND